jgi:type I restriction enzyme, S subunit
MSEVVVPNDWSLVDIGNVCKFSQGVQIGVEFHYKENNHNRVRFLRISDYTKTDEEPRYVDNSLAVKGQMEKDDVVMVRYGEAGRVCRGLEGAIANNLFTITPQNSLIKDYLYLSLISPDVSERIYALAASSTMPAINFTSLSKIKLLLPDSQKEQQKIASILTSVDEVIEKTQSQINKLQDLKKGTMNELLTKGIGHTEFKDRPVGKIPVEWEVDKLQYLVDKSRPITYGIVQAGKHIEKGIPYIRVSDMKHGALSLNGMLRTSHEIASKFTRSRVQCGDLVYALRGDVGKVLKISHQLEGANLTQGTALISKSEKIDIEFLRWVLQSATVKKQTQDLAKGSTFVEMTLGNLKQLKLVTPPLPEQQKIASILSSMDSYIEEKQRKLEQTQSLKKSLMQDLLTGKVRVAVH